MSAAVANRIARSAGKVMAGPTGSSRRSTTAVKSGGSADASATRSPVIGCSNPSVAAWSIRRARRQQLAAGRLVVADVDLLADERVPGLGRGGSGSGGSCRSRGGPRTASRARSASRASTWVTARLPCSRRVVEPRRPSPRSATRYDSIRRERDRAVRDAQVRALHRVRAQLRGEPDARPSSSSRTSSRPEVARSIRWTTWSGTLVAGLPIRRHAPRIRSIAVPVSRSSYGTLLTPAGLSITTTCASS